MNPRTIGKRKTAEESSQKPSKPVTAPGRQLLKLPRNQPPDQLAIFRLHAPTAQEVFLAAEFTEWGRMPIKMRKSSEGVWQASVSLSQGRHLYKFVVDGHWQDDPQGQQREPDGFGTFNSVREIIEGR